MVGAIELACKGAVVVGAGEETSTSCDVGVGISSFFQAGCVPLAITWVAEGVPPETPAVGVISDVLLASIVGVLLISQDGAPSEMRA